MAYEQMKRLIQRVKGNKELSVAERFAAGSSAGAISQTIIYPLEVLKTRLALRKTGQLDKGLIHFASKMYKQEGFLCFYKVRSLGFASLSRSFAGLCSKFIGNHSVCWYRFGSLRNVEKVLREKASRSEGTRCVGLARLRDMFELMWSARELPISVG